MENQKSMDYQRKSGINKLLRILWELDALKNQATDETTLRDFDIYIRDIRRFLEKSAIMAPLDEIEVYIDDYQGVISYMNGIGLNNKNLKKGPEILRIS